MTWIKITSLCGFAVTVQAMRIPVQEGEAMWTAAGEALDALNALPEASQGTIASAVSQIPATPMVVDTMMAHSPAASVAIHTEAAARVPTEAASAIIAQPEVTMITNVLTWLATDAEGNYVSKTSTYINDKADIDWEPSTLTFMDTEPTAVAPSPFPKEAGLMTEIGNIPIISYDAGPNFEEIPAWNPTIGKETVARSNAGTVATAAPFDTENSYNSGNMPFVGVPFAWLASFRGGEQVDNNRGSQRGRIEDDKLVNSTTPVKDYLDVLPSAIANLLRSDPNFNLGLSGDRTPSALELELLLNLGNGQTPVAATFIPNTVPSLILPSATVQMGGPAVTVQGQRLSLAPEGLIAGSKTISLQAVAPVNPTDYAAVFTLEEEKPPMTLVKEAGNPQFMYNNEATLTVGGPALTTNGHTIAYNTRGQIVIDNSQTIDPTPVKKADVAAATNRATGGGPSGASGSNTKSNGRMVSGILIDGALPDPSQGGSQGAQVAAQKAGADSASASTTTKKTSATAQAASSPSASTHTAAGGRSTEFVSGGMVVVVSFLAFLGALLIL